MTENNTPIPPEEERFLRWPEVHARIGLSRSQINKLIREGKFPRSFSITGGRARAWFKSHIDAWMEDRIKKVLKVLFIVA